MIAIPGLGWLTRIVRYALEFCGLALMIVTAAACGNSGGSVAVTQGLWVPNYHGNTVAEFLSSTRKTSGTPSADLTNSGTDLAGPYGSTFDKSRNLWVSNYVYGTAGTGSLAEYTLSQLKNLATTPAPSANVVISGLTGPTGLAFDSSGNLWVAEYNGNDLLGFTPSQLAASGSPSPAVTITSTSFANPIAVKFDKSGDLWLADGYSTADATGSTGEVFEFTPSQLSTGGMQTPAVSLATPTLAIPFAIAFDHSGNLWVANRSSKTLQEFAASDLHGTGVIQPAATVTIGATSVTTSTGTANSIDTPSGLAFDGSGNLWVANGTSDTNGSLAEFSASQLKVSGSPSPKVFLDSNPSGTNLNFPAQLTFGPSIK
jgi:sugar lactone lactonase YvrE